MKKVLFIFIIGLCVLSGRATPPDSTLSYAPSGMASNRVMQRFNPIYGSEPESNEIISFISANLVVGLDPEQMKKLDGYLVITFDIDTLGKIGHLEVRRSYNSWVDWVILAAMNELPECGVISRDSNGAPRDRRQQVVFTFGSYVKGGGGTYGFQGETVARNTQNELNKQKDEYVAQIKKQTESWRNYTDVNAKLEYDTKQGLKQEAAVLDGANPLDLDKSETSVIPTISITEL